ncbi:MAG: hypothetical protein IJQ21_11670 [Lachnospiraceae bacterium]|nr:hypothetical protein [Lachnospiraceae bacterium]
MTRNMHRKKTGRRMCAGLLVLFMSAALAACSAKAEPDENSGLYEAVSAKTRGIEVGLDDVFDEPMSIELKDGGKAVFSYEGKDYNMKWSRTGHTFEASGGGAELSGTLRDGVMEIEDVLDSGIDIRLECKSLVRKAARNDKNSGGLKTGNKPEDDGDTETPGGSDNGTGTASDASDAGPVGTSFAGDWEGMTFIRNASGSHEGLEVAGDWVFATYARIIIDENGETQMDMVGVMRNEPLNYRITKAAYNAGSDRLGVDGMVAGGDFHVIFDAPGDNGVLKMEGRTSGDIEASYVCYLKRLDSEWSRADAQEIPDREYIMYVENNMPLDRGLTLEERVAAAAEAGIVVDMSAFLPPEGNSGAQSASGTESGSENETDSTDGGAGSASGAGDDKYVNDGKDYAIKTQDLPSGYTPLPYDRFVEGYRAVLDGEVSSYEEVANAFGDDGIHMRGIVYAGYAYYGWYADKDYLSDTKVHVLVTFKEVNGQLTYYANSTVGITPQDVR